MLEMALKLSVVFGMMSHCLLEGWTHGYSAATFGGFLETVFAGNRFRASSQGADGLLLDGPSSSTRRNANHQGDAETSGKRRKKGKQDSKEVIFLVCAASKKDKKFDSCRIWHRDDECSNLKNPFRKAFELPLPNNLNLCKNCCYGTWPRHNAFTKTAMSSTSSGGE